MPSTKGDGQFSDLKAEASLGPILISLRKRFTNETEIQGDVQSLLFIWHNLNYVRFHLLTFHTSSPTLAKIVIWPHGMFALFISSVATYLLRYLHKVALVSIWVKREFSVRDGTRPWPSSLNIPPLFSWPFRPIIIIHTYIALPFLFFLNYFNSA